MSIRTDGLNVGDRVLVGESYGWQQRHKPGSVIKKTPSGITTVSIDDYPPHGTIAHEVTFSPDGWERERRYRGEWLDAFDEQVLAQEKHRELVRSKRSLLEDRDVWRKASDDMILKIAAIVEAKGLSG